MMAKRKKKNRSPKKDFLIHFRNDRHGWGIEFFFNEIEETEEAIERFYESGEFSPDDRDGAALEHFLDRLETSFESEILAKNKDWPNTIDEIPMEIDLERTMINEAISSFPRAIERLRIAIANGSVSEVGFRMLVLTSCLIKSQVHDLAMLGSMHLHAKKKGSDVECHSNLTRYCHRDLTHSLIIVATL